MLATATTGMAARIAMARVRGRLILCAQISKSVKPKKGVLQEAPTINQQLELWKRAKLSLSELATYSAADFGPV